MEVMHLDDREITKVLELLNDQRVTIGRMDERSKSTAETIQRMERDISSLKGDAGKLRDELQEVKNTAFRNAVIVGFIGAGVGGVLGSIITIFIRKSFGG